MLTRFPLFGSAVDVEPRPGPNDWDGLVTLFRHAAASTPHPCAGIDPTSADWRERKKAAPAWSPCSFRGPRGKATAVASSALALDLDDATRDDAAAFLEGLEARGLAYALHESLTPAAVGSVRCRVVLPLAEPISAVEWSYARLVAFVGADGLADPACGNPDRIFFLPTMRLDGSPGFVHVRAGVPLDVPRGGAAEATLSRLCAQLAAAAPGERHKAIARIAFTAGGLGLPEAREALLAVMAPWADDDAIRTLDAQLAAGAARPLRAPVTIQLSHRIDEMTDAAISALAHDAEIYTRGFELARVQGAEKDDTRIGVSRGTPQIRAIPIATLRERLARAASWERFDVRAGAWKPAAPPDPVVAAVAARGAWSGLRPLLGVVEAPTLRPDGSLLLEPGYDEVTALLLAPTVRIDPTPEQPTQADAAAALAALAEPFAEFPFASEAARFVPVAAILTMIGRAAIEGATPAFVFDATTRGSGKTLLADVVSIVATGRDAPKATWPGPGRDDEAEKILSAHALLGSRIVAFDNIASAFGGPPIDKVLTAIDRVSFRVLGRTETQEPEWRAVVIGTGNNVALAEDTARRVLLGRLEPDCERPEDRTGFRIPDLLGHVRRARGALVRAALLVLRAYVLAGRPEPATWGSFGPWAGLVPGAIRFAGGPDVLSCRGVSLGHGQDETDPLGAFLVALERECPNGASAAEILNAVPLRAAVHDLCPSTRPGEMVNAKGLGHVLRRRRGRVVRGRKLEGTTDRNGVSVWRVRRVGA